MFTNIVRLAVLAGLVAFLVAGGLQSASARSGRCISDHGLCVSAGCTTHCEGSGSACGCAP